MRKNRFYSVNLKADDKTVGELSIYGDIVFGKWDKWAEDDVAASEFKDDLDALGDIKTLNIYINSAGGNVFAGQAIHSMLKRHKATVNVHIDGIAASAASVIAVAGDKVHMPKNAMFMIHNCWTIALGNAEELRKAADTLDKINETIKEAYLSKTGDSLTEDQLEELLVEESWLTADEAYNYGFIDEISESVEIAASASSEIIKSYKHLPESLKKLLDNKDEGPTKEQIEAEKAELVACSNDARRALATL